MSFKNRKRNRLLDFDYSTDALYFATSCVKNFARCLGTVRNGIMGLNKYGIIAQQQFYWLENQYPYIQLHAVIVMPNHIHCVLEINRDLIQNPGNTKIKSLSQLMGAYKTTVSKQIRLAGNPNFAWHRSFYDHIIRSERAYQNIIRYIHDNPLHWNNDKFHRQY